MLIHNLSSSCHNYLPNYRDPPRILYPAKIGREKKNKPNLNGF